MAGIKRIGAHIPYLRFPRSEWVKVWKQEQLASIMLGEKTVANFDEDPITMGVTAALRAIEDNPEGVDGLFFASTSPPYIEKSNAALAACAVDLTEEARTADFSGSLKAGTTALISAWDAVKAGSLNNVLVVASDVRLSDPRYYMETMMGDCAAACLVGDGDDVIVEIKEAVSINTEFTDVWKRITDRNLRYEDEKYSSTHGYLKYVPMVLKKLFQKTGLQPDGVNRIIAYAPEGASYMALAKRSGFPHLWNTSPLLMEIGNAGTASPLIQLAAYLQDAKPGEKIILVGYGNGADAILMEVTDKIESYREKIDIRKQIETKNTDVTYAQILYWRNQLKRNIDSPWEFQPFTSIASIDRQRKYIFALYGHKCTKCGTVYYPPKRVCPSCGAKDSSEDVKLSKRGKIYSFEIDYVFPNVETPTCMTIIDLEGGGRLLTQMTDCKADEVKVGLEVELVLRKYHEAKGVYHYFWKARPKRF